METSRGHYALVELQKPDEPRHLISQNVDNLHLKSGIKPEILAEMHGNAFKLRVPRCGRKADIIHCPGNSKSIYSPQNKGITQIMPGPKKKVFLYHHKHLTNGFLRIE